MKHMLKTAVGVAAFGLSSIAFAGGGGVVPPVDDMAGLYVGGQLGFGLTNWGNLDAVNFPHAGDEEDFAWGLHIGYNFNHYFAAEFGYSWLPRNVDFGGVGKIRNWAFDFTGKMSVTLVDQIGFFGLLGVSYLRSSLSGKLAETGLPVPQPFHTTQTRFSNWNVTYGAGLFYDAYESLRFYGKWQRFHGKARLFTNDYQPFMDTFTIGVSYRIPNMGWGHYSGTTK